MKNLRKVDADEIVERLTRPHVVGARADFRQCHLGEPVNLSGRSLCGFDFSQSRFDAPVDFTGARFDGLSWFIGSRFRESCLFSHTCFANDARFDHCCFDSSVEFAAAEFRGIGAFDHAVFTQAANFSGSIAYGNFSLQDARISGPLRLTEATFMGGFWSPGADLPDCPETTNLQVHGRQYPFRF